MLQKRVAEAERVVLDVEGDELRRNDLDAGEVLLRWQDDFALVEVVPPMSIPFDIGDREFRFRDPFEEILHAIR